MLSFVFKTMDGLRSKNVGMVFHSVQSPLPPTYLSPIATIGRFGAVPLFSNTDKMATGKCPWNVFHRADTFFFLIYGTTVK
jgi:hypothetical protein